MKRDANILIIGCGNSMLGEQMVDDGYQNITNIDTSEGLIEQMTAKYKDSYPQLKFMVADVKKMSTTLDDEK